MKNITITLDEATAAWTRVHAAEKGISVSRLVGELLHQQMRQARQYEAAMQGYLAKRPVKLKAAGEKYATRDDLHDRARLR
jgi:hypothetical protein